MFSENLMAQKESKTSVSDGGYDSQQLISRTSMLSSSMLNVNPRNQLLQARDILELGLENVSYARQAVALNDGNSIADVGWAKVCIESFINLDINLDLNYVYKNKVVILKEFRKKDLDKHLLFVLMYLGHMFS